MECGKRTAKLRDAVSVCFVINGMEGERLRNIEIPDEIKKLPCMAFKFDVPQNRAITFEILFGSGVTARRMAGTPPAQTVRLQGGKPAQ